MAEQVHHGSCHCGAVRFRVELDLTQPALTCNCSICGRSGSMLTFVAPEKFTLQQGEGNLIDYQFGRQNIHHLFCRTCGIKSFGRGQGRSGPMIAINVRCLDDVDVTTQPTQFFDGKRL